MTYLHAYLLTLSLRFSMLTLSAFSLALLMHIDVYMYMYMYSVLSQKDATGHLHRLQAPQQLSGSSPPTTRQNNAACNVIPNVITAGSTHDKHYSQEVARENVRWYAQTECHTKRDREACTEKDTVV